MICDGCWHKNNCADYGEKLIHCEYFEPMTKEEYIKSCDTEQLAEAILQQWIHGTYHGVGEFGLTDKEIESAKDDIVEWLKQPHTKE